MSLIAATKCKAKPVYNDHPRDPKIVALLTGGRYNRSGMVKVRPSNLFLRPLNLFCYFKKSMHMVYLDKFGQNFFLISIKRTKFFPALQKLLLSNQ